jgi:hypothetical protein
MPRCRIASEKPLRAGHPKNDCSRFKTISVAMRHAAVFVCEFISAPAASANLPASAIRPLRAASRRRPPIIFADREFSGLRLAVRAAAISRKYCRKPLAPIEISHQGRDSPYNARANSFVLIFHGRTRLRKFRLDNGTAAGRVSDVGHLRSVGRLSFWSRSQRFAKLSPDNEGLAHRDWIRSRNMFVKFKYVCNGLQR